MKESTWQWTDTPAHPSMKAAMDARPARAPSPDRVHTPEEIEEEVQMVTDMMTKNGFSQQEIDEYIQQLRERYAQ